MASVGRFTTAQRTAIQAGNNIWQRWIMYVPLSAAHSSFVGTVIAKSGSISPLSEHTDRIIRAGSRKHSVWNPSPNVSVKPKAVRYSFVVTNDDGKFFETTTDNFFYYAGGYQASPQECYIRHQIYVVLDDGTDSEITHMEYKGRIIEVKYTDIATDDGTPAAAVATIICEQLGAWKELSRVWTVEDSEDVPMTGATFDFTWTVT